jgi:hypothetical protein
MAAPSFAFKVWLILRGEQLLENSMDSQPGRLAQVPSAERRKTR